MNDVPKQRRNSFSSTEKQREATIDVAQNSLGHAQQTSVTVTAENIRGITQANAKQHPTVYLKDPSGDPMGRITQEHNVRENVGAHPQHGTEWYFNNLSTGIIDKTYARQKTELLRKKGALSLGDASAKAEALRMSVEPRLEDVLVGASETALRNPAENTGKKQLVEVYLGQNLSVSGTHVSRSAFQDLSGPGMREAREHMVKRLETGPLGAKSLSKMPGGSKDDWDAL